MNAMAVLAAGSVGCVVAGMAGSVFRRPVRLGARIGRYTAPGVTARDRTVDRWASATTAVFGRGLRARLLGPPLVAWARRGSRLFAIDDDRLAERLRHAGFDPMTTEEYRVRTVARILVAGAAGLLVGGVLLHSGVWAIVLAGCGVAHGLTRDRGRVERAIADRRERARLELATVDQLLAMHVRAGAGPLQAVGRLTEHGHGVVIGELRGVLEAVRSGASESEAFRRAAERTVEPHAARTYRLFAAAAEQGADLGEALRALSDDLRDAHREEIRRRATRRRAAMLVPTIAVLAPVMLLFVGAPLPTIVFGSR
jgi:Flp pilus assembly protein TadB